MKYTKGIVSIFLALILLPVYSIALMAMDLVKITSSNTHLYTANELAMHSLMSKYERDLYNKYNIFAISKDSEYINSYVDDILKSNLDENKSNFYNTKLNSSNVNIDPESNLLSNNVLEKQIVDYMRLKAPYDLSKGILNLINLVTDSKQYNQVINKKFDYEESYSNMNTNIDELGEKIFSYNNGFDKINKEFFDMTKKFNKLKEELKKLKESIKEEENIDEDSETHEAKEEKKKIEETNKKTEKEIKAKLKEFKEYMDDLWTNISVFNVEFSDMIYLLENISTSSEKVQIKLNDWKNSVNTLDDSDIKSNFKSEIKSNNHEFTKENIDNLLKKLIEHEQTLENMLKTITKDSKLKKPSYEDLDHILNSEISTKNNKKLPSLNNYKIYKYLLRNKEKLEISKDETKAAKKQKKEIENFASKISEIEKIEVSNSIYDFLSNEDINKIGKYNSTSIGSIGSNAKISNFKSIINQTNTHISNKHNNIIDNLYIAQYIIDKFNHKLEDNNEFSSQIEYILFGNDSLNNNISSIDNLILGIRFSLNSIYAFTNVHLGREATILATAIAGWTGFGVPLVRTLLLASMSLGESILDLQNLNKDKALEAYKNKATWQVSISGLPNLIGKGVKEISNEVIDNIYESVEDFSNEKIDKFNKDIDEFIAQSIDGLSQTILSEIVTPLQVYISNMITQSKKDIDSQLSQIFNDIKSRINKSNENLLELKYTVLSLVEQKLLKDIDSINEMNFESYFTSLAHEIESYIRSSKKDLTENFKSNLSDTLYASKIKRKEMVSNYIDKYLEDLGTKTSFGITTKSGIGGLNFKYKDYLLLVTYLRLLSGGRKDILNRMALVMEYEIKKYNPSFDITSNYTKFELISDIKLNTFILKRYIFIDKIKSELIGGY